MISYTTKIMYIHMKFNINMYTNTCFIYQHFNKTTTCITLHNHIYQLDWQANYNLTNVYIKVCLIENKPLSKQLTYICCFFCQIKHVHLYNIYVQRVLDKPDCTRRKVKTLGYIEHNVLLLFTPKQSSTWYHWLQLSSIQLYFDKGISFWTFRFISLAHSSKNSQCYITS